MTEWFRGLIGSKPEVKPTEPLPAYPASEPSRTTKPKSAGRPPVEFDLFEALRLHREGEGYRKIARRMKNVSYETVRKQILDYEARFGERKPPVPIATVKEAETPSIKPEPTEQPESSISPALQGALQSLLSPGVGTIPPAPPVDCERVPAEETVTLPEPDRSAEPIDWSEEARTDLPPRSPARIQFLLQYESEEQTRARIRNDKIRYMNQHGFVGQSLTLPQGRFRQSDRFTSTGR
jgi:hypothetical protein